MRLALDAMILPRRILPACGAISALADTCQRLHISRTPLRLAGASRVGVPHNQALTAPLVMLNSAAPSHLRRWRDSQVRTITVVGDVDK